MLKLLTASVLLLSSAAIQAMPIYSYSTNNLGQSIYGATPAGGVNANGGNVESLETTYNPTTGAFTWNYEAAPGGSNNDNDGFWLVVSDGPGPKYHTGEYAILYGDTLSQQVTAYEYDGANSSGSYSDSNALLKVFQNSISSTKDMLTGITSVSMSINVTDINNAGIGADWDGVQFGDQIGIWFHPTANSQFSYLASGGIASYSGQAGWYDTIGPLTTNQVPEPGMLALLAIGAVGFVRRKKPAIVS